MMFLFIYKLFKKVSELNCSHKKYLKTMLSILQRISFQVLVVSDGLHLFSVTNYLDVGVSILPGSHVSIGYRYEKLSRKNTYSWQNAAFRMSSIPGNTGT